MSKVNIKRLDSVTKNDTTATEQINDNFSALQEAIENTLSRKGTTPNYMDADLDMNSYRIINSADPKEENDIVNLKYVDERIGGAVEASKSAVNAATQAANSAQSALVSSTNAINTLRNAEEQLDNVVTYVDEAIQTIDNTIAEAVEDVKQQALDAAQESINTAAEQATTIVIDYANNEVKPELMTFVTSAEEDATSAAESAKESRKWAEGSDTEVTALGGEHSSKTWNGMTKQYATSASQSATQAKTSETNAKSYADSIEPDRFLNKEMITNCITEIPQDIKLELNNGTLTLKAGSKVYVPNGSGVFEEVRITADKTATTAAGNNGQYFVMIPNKGTATWFDILNVSQCVSGATDTLGGSSWHMWYDTANNQIKWYGSDGAVFERADTSLPIALVTVANNAITSIDQVFNGFGYIGSTVFALPGVKGLIPNGRNADGSLRNKEFVTNNVIVSAAYGGNWSGQTYFDGIEFIYTNTTTYNKDLNILIDSHGFIGENTHCCIGNHVVNSDKVTLCSKLPFHAVDYQEVEDIVNNLTKHVVVSVLPVEPEEDVFYYIPE